MTARERGAVEADVVIVGSGINSLVCAALLARRGKKVVVLERADRAGGCIRTEALTAPGFVHDTLSTLYPLFVTAPHFPELEPELVSRGVAFLQPPHPTAVLLPDGRSLILTRDREANVAALEAAAPGDGEAYRRAMDDIGSGASITFGLLGGELWSWATLRLLLSQAVKRGPAGLAGFFGAALQSCRSWLEGGFRSDLARALFAPWVLHLGLSPESTLSGHMGKLVVFTLEQAGAPVVRGGGAELVEAFAGLIETLRGGVVLDADVEEVMVEGGAARGVRTSDGRTFRAREAVVCNVTPTQLYGRLLAQAPGVPEPVRRQAKAYRYGRGEMQIHLALSEPPHWPDPELGRVGMLHLTPGLDGVSRAVNEAERGLLPAEATIVVAQPMAADPSRAPAGRWIFWVQLQELPRVIAGDALGLIDAGDGAWSEAVRESYADRIVDRLCAQIPNLRASIMARHVISPSDLERLNINLVGGDPYSGACELDQFMLWRPLRAVRNHRTPIRRLLHIGASTHPGPGLGGMSGLMAAQDIR